MIISLLSNKMRARVFHSPLYSIDSTFIRQEQRSISHWCLIHFVLNEKKLSWRIKTDCMSCLWRLSQRKLSLSCILSNLMKHSIHFHWKYPLTEEGLVQTVLSVNKMERYSVKSLSLPLLGELSWCAETRAGSQLALGEAWHNTGCHWRDEPQTSGEFFWCHFPLSDSSDVGTRKTNKRRRRCSGRMKINTDVWALQLFWFL